MWRSNKRPCDEGNPINIQRKRAAAVSVAATSSALLPQPAGYCFGDSRALDQIRQPPLPVLTARTSTESPSSRMVGLPSRAAQEVLRDPTNCPGPEDCKTCGLMRRLTIGLSLLHGKVETITEAEHFSSDGVSCSSTTSKQFDTHCHHIVFCTAYRANRTL